MTARAAALAREAHALARVELAAAFRFAARLGLNEAVANHFSLAVSPDGRRFLMNPNQVHFSLIRASDLLVVDADDPAAMEGPDAPDPTAWALHGALHRTCAHARCAMHVHSIHATVLASLADPTLLPIDQNTAGFYGRVAVDPDYGGLALGPEAERVCGALADPTKQVLVMANHGIMVVGANVAETFTRLYYFERAAETYVKALATGRALRVLSDAVAAKTAAEMAAYPGQAERFLASILRILDRDGEDFRE